MNKFKKITSCIVIFIKFFGVAVFGFWLFWFYGLTTETDISGVLTKQNLSTGFESAKTETLGHFDQYESSIRSFDFFNPKITLRNQLSANIQSVIDLMTGYLDMKHINPGELIRIPQISMLFDEYIVGDELTNQEVMKYLHSVEEVIAYNDGVDYGILRGSSMSWKADVTNDGIDEIIFQGQDGASMAFIATFVYKLNDASEYERYLYVDGWCYPIKHEGVVYLLRPQNFFFGYTGRCYFEILYIEDGFLDIFMYGHKGIRAVEKDEMSTEMIY